LRISVYKITLSLLNVDGLRRGSKEANFWKERLQGSFELNAVNIHNTAKHGVATDKVHILEIKRNA
jgi:hypothetical protein